MWQIPAIFRGRACRPAHSAMRGICHPLSGPTAAHWVVGPECVSRIVGLLDAAQPLQHLGCEELLGVLPLVLEVQEVPGRPPCRQCLLHLPDPGAHCLSRRWFRGSTDSNREPEPGPAEVTSASIASAGSSSSSMPLATPGTGPGGSM